MSKIVPVKDIGIPVPPPAPAPPPNTPAPPAPVAIACYYGTKGFKPDYAKAARVQLPLSALSQTTVNNVAYYDFPVSTVLPANLPDGDMDFVFTLVDPNGSEGDFSPAVTETVDRTPPPALGQPIVLP